MMTKHLRYIIIASITMLASSLMVFGQTPNPIKVPLKFTTNTGASRSVWFGWNAGGSYCIDNAPFVFGQCDTVLEEERPPFPPSEVFACQFVNTRTNNCGGDGIGQGLDYNIHLNQSAAQRDTFRVKFQPGNGGYPMTVSWPSGLSAFFDSAFVNYYDPDQDLNINLDMKNNTSFQVLNSGYNNYFVVYTYGLKGSQTPPDAPALSAPANGATGQSPTSLALNWASVTGAIQYKIQLALDTTFVASSIVVDSVVTGTSFTATGLYGGVKYFWRVKAYNSFLAGCYDAERSFITSLLTAPTLVLPSDQATGVNTNPILKVRKIYAVTSYEFVVSQNSGFSSIVTDTTVQDTSVTLATTLINCVSYYWKVKASTQYATGPFSTSHSFVVIDIIPEVPTPSLPADSAVIPNTNQRPTFTWSSDDICSRKYRFEISKDSLFTTKIDSQVLTGLTYQLQQPLEGQQQYYWRVWSINGLNQSSPTPQARTLTTAVFTPLPPVLRLPVNGNLESSDTVTLLWNVPKNKPVTYTLFYDTLPNFSTQTKVTLISDTTYKIGPLNYCTRYFWKVGAVNTASQTGDGTVSAPFAFDVRRNIPDPPIPLYPVTGDTGVTDSLPLRWKGNACSQMYNLQVSLLSDFSQLLENDTVSQLSKFINEDNSSTIYYWRVCGINEKGVGEFATTSFKTAALTRPKPPHLHSPVLANLGVGQYPTLCWDSVKSARSYRVQLSLDTTFSRLVVNDSTPTGLCRQVGPLLYSRTYYWRVNAKNPVGTSNYSSVWWFNTLFPPDSTILLYPDDGATGVPVSPMLQWTVPDRENGYQLEVARDPGFNVIIFNDSSLQNQSWQLYNLSNRTIYYWRVRALNDAGAGLWSSTFSFKTTIVGVSDWVMPLTVGETGFGQDSIYFGINPTATAGIDPPLGEFELPPVYPGQFDARFVDIPSRPGLLGQGLRLNYLPFHFYAQVDTFRFSFQLGTGTYPVHLSWNSSFVRGICDSMVMLDMFGGLGLRERMDLVSSASVTNISTTSLMIIVYGAYPIPTDVKPQKVLPQGFTLSQNYPNPFNPETRIDFSNDKEATIVLNIYDVLGREVNRLVDGDMLTGFHTVVWNGQNQLGNVVPSGIYYLRMVATPHDLKTGQYVSSRKMLFMK